MNANLDKLLVSVLALTVIIIGYVLFSLSQYSNQIQTLDIFKSYKLGDKDAWGNKIHYEEKDGKFIMVSYGLFGKPEYSDYWRLREEKGSFHLNICHQWTRDSVKTDLGWVQLCSK